jgi:hypothetical protein
MPQDRSGGLAKIHTLDRLDEITRAASERSGWPIRAPTYLQEARISAALGFVWFFARGSTLHSSRIATRAPVCHGSGIFSRSQRRVKVDQVDAAHVATCSMAMPERAASVEPARCRHPCVGPSQKNRTAATQKCVTMRRRLHLVAAQAFQVAARRAGVRMIRPQGALPNRQRSLKDRPGARQIA